MITRLWKCKNGERLTITTNSFTKIVDYRSTRRIPPAVAVRMRKFRPLQEPIRLLYLFNSARSRAQKKIENNTWARGDMEFIFSCSHSISHSFAALTRSISMWTLEDKFHISKRFYMWKYMDFLCGRNPNKTLVFMLYMEFIFSCSHSISISFAALSRSISMWTLEDKFYISARPCIILYVLFHKNCYLLVRHYLVKPDSVKVSPARSTSV